MKKFGLLSLLSLAIIISSCCIGGKEDVVKPFTDDETKWFIYNENDTLTFATIDGETEKYYVKSVIRDTFPRHEKFSSDCKIKHIEEYLVQFAKIPQDDSYKSYSLSFMTYSFSTLIDWYDFSYSHFHQLPLASFTLGDNIYEDVWRYTIHSQNTNNYIKLAYSKSKGMLQYELTDGRVFSRVFDK